MRTRRIHQHPLPDTFPHTKNMSANSESALDYTADVWELDYEGHPYLNCLRDDELLERHDNIVRNMRSYLWPRYCRFSISNHISSWYWHRKEHQTRLELSLRDLPMKSVSLSPTEDQNWLLPNSIPNGSQVIFRYGKRDHMKDMVNFGRMRISPAESYTDPENNLARRDDETSKHTFISGKNAKITMTDGKRIPIIGDIKRSESLPDYYVMCFSCIWDLELFTDFEADTCVVIYDPKEFFRRVSSVGPLALPKWHFHHNPITYFDPYEPRRKNAYFSAAMCKAFHFAYQREYRALWISNNGELPSGYRFLEIGNSADIMAMYDINGRQVA